VVDYHWSLIMVWTYETDSKNIDFLKSQTNKLKLLPAL